MQLIFYLVQSQAVDHNCRICSPFDKMYDDIGYAATIGVAFENNRLMVV